MIFITGAGGTTGGQLIQQLEAKGASFRCGYFSIGSAESARARGIETAMIDYDKLQTLRAAFEGCDSLFLLGPNTLNQTEQELNAVEAAKAAGVRHIVKQSVMGAGDESYSLAKVHRPVEKAIESSGLSWTMLRPNSFMQNAVTFMGETIRRDSAIYTATGQAKISHVDVRDIAAVAVKALTEAGHAGKAYTLTGSEPLSYDEVASEISKALGRRISHVNLPPSDLKNAMKAEGMPEPLVDRMMDLERYFREGHASRVTDDIRRVTGREPRRYADYIREIAAAGIWGAARAAK